MFKHKEKPPEKNSGGLLPAIFIQHGNMTKKSRLEVRDGFVFLGAGVGFEPTTFRL